MGAIFNRGKMLEHGNIDLNNRPVVPNPSEGGYSTVRSMSFNEGGKEVLVPTVVGSKIVSDQEAIDSYHKTGQHLGMFSNVRAANRYAVKLHNDQESQYASRARLLGN